MPVIPSYEMWVARIRSAGAAYAQLEDLPVNVVAFRRELRRAAKAAGMHVLTSIEDGTLLAWDPVHAVSEERMRAGMDALTRGLTRSDPSGARIIPSMGYLGPVAQPRCPHCRVLMRDAPRGFECPACGHRERVDYESPEPPEFDGPSIHGG